MEKIKTSAMNDIIDFINKEHQKRYQLEALIITLIFSLVGNAIGCIIIEVYRESGASLTPTMIAISICWGICWIRYRNKMKKIK